MIINFYKGQGGGSYTLPVASATQLGGVKVGENLSIDGNGVLSAGGGESNYVIVDDLSGITTPYEGLVAYVKEDEGVRNPKEYIHTGTEWVNKNQYFDFSTNDWNSTKCANFRTWINAIPEPIRNAIKWSGKIGPIRDGSYNFYEGPLTLMSVGANTVVFNAMDYTIASDGGLNPLASISLKIGSNVDYQYNNQLPDLFFKIESNHNLSTYGTLNYQKLGWLNYARGIFNKGDINITLIYDLGNNKKLYFAPQVTTTGYSEGNLIINEVREGVRYKGKWSISTGGSTLISWEEKTAIDMVKLTQAEYDALATKDANTFYVIVG